MIGSFYDFNYHEKSGNNENKKQDYFTIVFWDDGESIIKTLFDSILNEKKIRSDESFESAKKLDINLPFRVIRENYELELGWEFYYFDDLPDKNSKPDEILVSSFLPGVSRLPIISRVKILCMTKMK